LSFQKEKKREEKKPEMKKETKMLPIRREASLTSS
jgi:hypothetical protein